MAEQLFEDIFDYCFVFGKFSCLIEQYRSNSNYSTEYYNNLDCTLSYFGLRKAHFLNLELCYFNISPFTIDNTVNAFCALNKNLIISKINYFQYTVYCGQWTQ